jgi:hypothetical protein
VAALGPHLIRVIRGFLAFTGDGIGADPTIKIDNSNW